MKKGIVKNYFWGFKKGTELQFDYSGKLKENAIGVYDSNGKFIVYLFDNKMIKENIEF